MKEQIEVERRLKKLSQIHKPGRWRPESYIGANQSSFVFLNLKVPYIRNEQKLGYSFSTAPMAEQWEIWDHIWQNTTYFEAALAAAHFANARPLAEVYKHYERLLQWQQRVDNWAHSDELSCCYARLLEFDRKTMLPCFEAWSASASPWEKRQSMVGLLYYSRFRKKTLSCSKILHFVKPHIKDSHYYVQKAVGWTLRECWNVYPDKTMAFLRKNAKLIPPGGWTAATEKLPKKDKALLVKLRKGLANV